MTTISEPLLEMWSKESQSSSKHTVRELNTALFLMAVTLDCGDLRLRRRNRRGVGKAGGDELHNSTAGPLAIPDSIAIPQTRAKMMSRLFGLFALGAQDLLNVFLASGTIRSPKELQGNAIYTEGISRLAAALPKNRVLAAAERGASGIYSNFQASGRVGSLGSAKARYSIWIWATTSALESKRRGSL